jgi:hypothetical protein
VFDIVEEAVPGKSDKEGREDGKYEEREEEDDKDDITGRGEEDRSGKN